MRGNEKRCDEMFKYVQLQEWIAADNQLRAIRPLVEEVLEKMSGKLATLHSHKCRPSIPPEQLL